MRLIATQLIINERPYELHEDQKKRDWALIFFHPQSLAPLLAGCDPEKITTVWELFNAIECIYIKCNNINKIHMAALTTWVIDPTHSEIQFKVRHLVISTVTGSFKSFEGTVESGTGGFEDADVSFSADVTTIDTNQAQRDAHLRSADFFDAEKYPKLTFTGKLLGSNGDYTLKGNLTIKDITKPFEFAVEHGGSMTDFYGNEKTGFELSGKLNRKEFGLEWSAVTEAGGVVVGDEVKLIANVQVTKQ
jgi:polyisoprenoid-binding protein YceI